MSARRIPLIVNPAPTEEDKTALILILQDGLNKAFARIEELESPTTFILERSRNVHRDMKDELRRQQAVCLADDTAHVEHAKFLYALRICALATACSEEDLRREWLNFRSAGDVLDGWAESKALPVIKMADQCDMCMLSLHSCCRGGCGCPSCGPVSR